MRRAKKEEILSTIKLLHMAHEAICRITNTQNRAVEDVLAACQECAIQIGTEIEKSEGEGTKTVKLLEEYCECLYQCIQPEHSHRGRDIYSELESCLISIERKFVREIHEKLEVVFLPYNASMWDSLESVWKAAAEDETCNAYVVPIPFYDKNPDGSFGNLHYEGNLLPDYVPVVSWEDYDLRERKPDMVFIHNPYDDGNLVTSVHPDYYATELKKYTPKLVYIPYYLYVNDAASEGTILTKGVLNADYVIIQSEECCRQCIKIYDAFCKAHNLQNKVKPGKDKFLPLGSPIVDSTSGEADWDTVPLEWKQKIWEGNKKKKVVFYNTHLSDVMYVNAENFFKKVQVVLKIFRQQQDIVLLWRPHPLTWQTIQAMNPSAAEQYQKLVDNYRAEDWGIYDDTSDLKRSVRISDAYYGDPSSVVTMFQEAGKPVMLQNLEMLEEETEC